MDLKMALKDWKKKEYHKYQIAWYKETDKDSFQIHFARTKDVATVLQEYKYVIWLSKTWGSASAKQWEKGFNSMPEAITYAKSYMRTH
jgi:hypothetical protein